MFPGRSNGTPPLASVPSLWQSQWTPIAVFPSVSNGFLVYSVEAERQMRPLSEASVPARTALQFGAKARRN